MKHTLTLTIIVACVLVACKNSNQSATNTAPPPAQNAPHVDSTNSQNIVATPALAANGMNTIRYADGTKKMEGETKDGKRIGEWKSYHPNGQLWSDEFFADGKADGKVTVYYDNGKKMYEGENKNGVLTGVWNYWNEKGDLTRTVDYSKQPMSHR